MDLLLVIDENKSHYVYIKDFDRFMFHKTKNKNKKWFCKSCLQCFSSENVLIKHKEDCLSINGQQSINLEKGTIEFKNYFKQIPVPFKIYADFECNLKGVESSEGSYSKKYQDQMLILILNLHINKKVPVIFHNLRGYDSHLSFCELNKFDVKIDVIPNRLEKHMTFFLSKNLVFIDSIQFMNSSLEKLVKNLSENDFKNLTKEFGSKNLELLKQKGAYSYEYMDNFKRFNEEKLPDRECFYSSVKYGTTGGNGKELDGHINNKDYLTCKKAWNEFNMKNMGDYHDNYLKKNVLLLVDVFEKCTDMLKILRA